MLIRQSYPVFWTIFLLLFTAPIHATAKSSSSKSTTVNCPEIAEHSKSADIRFLTGRVELPDYKAHIDVPADLRFVSTADARSHAHRKFKWPKCTLRSLVGFILPPENILNSSNLGAENAWMIKVYYEPTYVSPEDFLNTDFDDIIQQVRDSYFKRERLNYRIDGTGRIINVMGWAIAPDYDLSGESVMWSLNKSSHNLKNYSVPIHMLKMGREGYFTLETWGEISQIQATAELMQKASNSLNFKKESKHGVGNSIRLKRGWTHAGLGPAVDWKKTTTIGTVIADSLYVRRATPLTWPEYFAAVLNGLLKVAVHYLLELLAFATIVILLMLVRAIKRRWRPRHSDDYGYEDEYYEDDYPDKYQPCRDGFYQWPDPDEAQPRRTQSSPAFATLNGVPLDRVK